MRGATTGGISGAPARGEGVALQPGRDERRTCRSSPRSRPARPRRSSLQLEPAVRLQTIAVEAAEQRRRSRLPGRRRTARLEICRSAATEGETCTCASATRASACRFPPGGGDPAGPRPLDDLLAGRALPRAAAASAAAPPSTATIDPDAAPSTRGTMRATSRPRRAAGSSSATPLSCSRSSAGRSPPRSAPSASSVDRLEETLRSATRSPSASPRDGQRAAAARVLRGPAPARAADQRRPARRGGDRAARRVAAPGARRRSPSCGSRRAGQRRRRPDAARASHLSLAGAQTRERAYLIDMPRRNGLRSLAAVAVHSPASGSFE